MTIRQQQQTLSSSPQYRLAQQLMTSRQKDMTQPGAGLVNAVNSIAGSYLMSQAREAEEKKRKARSEALASAMAGGGLDIEKLASSPATADLAETLALEKIKAGMRGPDLQFNPVTGEMFDMNKGAPYRMAGAGSSVAGNTSYGDINPATLTPKGRMKLEQQIIEDNSAKSQREKIEFEQQQQGKEDQREALLYNVNELLKPENRESLNAITGPMQSRLPTVRPESLRIENLLNQTQDMLTLENIPKMSGPLSDRDIEMLRSAAAGQLDKRLGDEAIVGALTRVRDALGGNSPTPQINVDDYTLDDIEAEIKRRQSGGQ